jgi:hypothetical protein
MAAGEPHLTRMVIFGAMLGVLDPVLTLAAADMQFQGVMRRTNPAAAQLKQGKDGGEFMAGFWLSGLCVQCTNASLTTFGCHSALVCLHCKPCASFCLRCVHHLAPHTAYLGNSCPRLYTRSHVCLVCAQTPLQCP